MTSSMTSGTAGTYFTSTTTSTTSANFTVGQRRPHLGGRSGKRGHSGYRPICPMLNSLAYPRYVMAMGWRRWGMAARRKWAKILRAACLQTVRDIDEWLWTAFDG